MVHLGQAEVAGWRLQVARDSVAMIKQRPVLGWGLGTFPTVFPRFKSVYDDVLVNEAHDDYLQLLVETGVVGCILAGWFLWNLLSASLRELRKAPSWQANLTRACLIGIAGILVHSVTDFNLHIPANAALFYSMCFLATSEDRAAVAPNR